MIGFRSPRICQTAALVAGMLLAVGFSPREVFPSSSASELLREVRELRARLSGEGGLQPKSQLSRHSQLVLLSCQLTGLAGLAAGVWHSPDDFLQSRSFTRFEPSDAERANGCHAEWRRAVRTALAWARDDD